MASIEQRGEHRWTVRYRADGRSRSRTFRRQVDARRFSADVERAHHRGELFDPAAGRITFGVWSDRWIDGAVQLKPKTIAGYRSILDKHLLPRWRDVTLSRITRPAVQAWVGEISGNGVGAGTIRNVVTAFKASLTAAVEDGLILTNPAARVRLPRPQRADKTFLTAEQVNLLADAIEARYRSLILVAAYSGLRAGEIAALTWRRVDTTRGTVEVVESYAEVHGRLELGVTKTYQRRTVRLPRFVIELFDEMRGPGGALVFTDTTGGPLRQSNFYRRHFRPAVERAGLPTETRFHDLRHTHAALLIAAGAHPLTIKQRLGHSSIAVTLDTYGGLFPEIEEDLAGQLDDTYRALGNRSCVESVSSAAD